MQFFKPPTQKHEPNPAALQHSAPVATMAAPLLEDMDAVLREFSDASFLLDSEWRFVETDAGAVALLGASEEALVGREVWDMFPAAHGTPFERACRLAMEQKTATLFHGDVLNHPGLVSKAYLLPTDEGLRVYCRNFTEEARANAVLRHSEATYHELLSALPAAVYVCDVEGRITLFNSKAAEWWGREPKLLDNEDKFCGSSRLFEDGRPVEHSDSWMAKTLATRQAVRGEKVEIERPDGGRAIARVNIEPLYDEKGQFIGAVNVFLDVTEQHRTEEALRASEERFRTLAENIAQLSWTADASGFRTWYNKRWFEYTGVNEEETLGWGWTSVHHPDHVERVVSNLRRCFQTGEVWEDTIPLRGKDGEYRWFLARVVPIRDEHGEIRLWFGANTDVTERLEAERKLEELNQTLEQRVAERTIEAQRLADQLRALAAEITRVEHRERRRLALVLHDHIQQLLVAAKMQVELIARGSKPENAPKAAERVGRILKEAIAESRSLTVELSPPVLHTSGLGAGLEWLADHMAEKHGFTVDIQAIDPVEPNTEEVRLLLFESAKELLFNSVKHSGVFEATVVFSSTPDGRTMLIVRDTGRGFELSSIGTGTNGGNFGLFSVQQRFAYFGGEVLIETEPGKGVQLTLIGPRESVGDSLDASGHSRGLTSKREFGADSRQAGGAIRVLLVDDHKLLREGLAGLLKDESSIEIVGEAENALEALELTARLSPDVIVMDVNLPDMDGIEATRIIRREWPRIRVVALSMHAQDEVAASMRDAGAAAYLTKGAPATDLVRAIQTSCQPIVE